MQQLICSNNNCYVTTKIVTVSHLAAGKVNITMHTLVYITTNTGDHLVSKISLFSYVVYTLRPAQHYGYFSLSEK